MGRVAVVYDGFNFYYGLRKLKNKVKKCYYWLDLRRLSEWLCAERPDATAEDTLEHVVYFTANIKSDDGQKVWRQQNYFNLLGALGNVEIIRGEYVIRDQRCHTCDAEPAICQTCRVPMKKHQEKQTDVNLALWTIIAAYKDYYDDIVIVTSDSDLAGVSRQVELQFPEKRAYIVFPPEQIHHPALIHAASGHFSITEDMLLDCIMRRTLKISGSVYRCPRHWLQGRVVPD